VIRIDEDRFLLVKFFSILLQSFGLAWTMGVSTSKLFRLSSIKLSSKDLPLKRLVKFVERFGIIESTNSFYDDHINTVLYWLLNQG